MHGAHQQCAQARVGVRLGSGQHRQHRGRQPQVPAQRAERHRVDRRALRRMALARQCLVGVDAFGQHRAHHAGRAVQHRAAVPGARRAGGAVAISARAHPNRSPSSGWPWAKSAALTTRRPAHCSRSIASCPSPHATSRCPSSSAEHAARRGCSARVRRAASARACQILSGSPRSSVYATGHGLQARTCRAIVRCRRAPVDQRLALLELGCIADARRSAARARARGRRRAPRSPRAAAARRARPAARAVPRWSSRGRSPPACCA